MYIYDIIGDEWMELVIVWRWGVLSVVVLDGEDGVVLGNNVVRVGLVDVVIDLEEV